MKIVHVMTWYIDNMGYQENFLPYEQSELGFDVQIICCADFPEFDGLDMNKIEPGTYSDKGIIIHRLPCKIVKGRIFLKGLKSKLKELNPDIVQSHGTFMISTIQTVLWQKEMNYNLFIDDHSHENNFFLYSFQKKYFKLFYKIYGERVKKFMPVTYSAKEIIKDIIGMPDDKISMVHLGANSELFRYSPEKLGEIRKEMGFNDEILILSTGKFSQSKDVHILIEAFHLISQIHNNVRLMLMGSFPDDYLKEIKNLINKYSLNDKIIFKDFVKNKDLNKYYNSADIGVWPGDHSITVIEAVSSGLPVIVPSNVKAYNILTNNKSAKSFERGNAKSLANQINILIESEATRRNITNHAQILIKECLSWKAVAKKTIKIYNDANEGSQ